MLINNQPIFYNNYSKHNTSFGTSVRGYNNPNINSIAGSTIYTSTRLFREDLDFGALADKIIDNFADKDKVNIKCLAGSDGSEAYSLAIALLERIPKKDYKKYFPIISIDKDKIITETAQKGRINLSQNDFNELEKNIKSGKQYFIKPNETLKILDNQIIDDSQYKSYEPIKELKDAVEFRTGDLLEELRTLKDDGNSVILCRNVMPYLHPAQVSHIAYDTKENLKSGSIFAIGNFDKNTEIKNYLYFYDFRETQSNVFIVPNQANWS